MAEAATIINRPRVVLNLLQAQLLVTDSDQRVLFVAQKTSGGSATPGQLIENIQNDTLLINNLFGANSMIAGMIRKFRELNTVTPVDAIALADNGGGAAATATVTFTGTATENGELRVSIGSDRDHAYIIGVDNTDTATDIGDKFEALVNADTNAPFTASNGAGVVTVNFAHGGLIGNETPSKYPGTVAGTTVAVTAFSGGTLNPVLTGVLDPIENIRYQTFPWVYTDSTGVTFIKDFLDARFNASTGKVMDGMAVYQKTLNFSDTLNDLSSLNSASLSPLYDDPIDEADYKGPSIFEMPYIKSAIDASLRSLRLTEGANISRFVTNTASGDQFGGIHIATLPYFNTPIPNLPLPDARAGFSGEIGGEQDQIGDAGGSLWGQNPSRTGVIYGDMRTTRTEDNASNDNESLSFRNYVDGGSVVREIFTVNLRANYPQHRLTGGNAVPNHAIVDEEDIRTFMKRIYKVLADSAIVETGPTSVEGVQVVAEDYFNENLTIVIDTLGRLAAVNFKFLMVTQLGAIIGNAQIAFSGQG